MFLNIKVILLRLIIKYNFIKWLVSIKQLSVVFRLGIYYLI